MTGRQKCTVVYAGSNGRKMLNSMDGKQRNIWLDACHVSPMRMTICTLSGHPNTALGGHESGSWMGQTPLRRTRACAREAQRRV